MKWLVSYLKDDEIVQKVIIADECKEVSVYMQQVDTPAYSIISVEDLLGPAKPLATVMYNPEVVATSKLAKVDIAAEDYNIGGIEKDGKHYFNFEGALEVEKNLRETGWRLPTRSEWALICEEFGQKDGQLNTETLYENLNMSHTGYYNYSDGKVYNRTADGFWWSATRASATGANSLYTSTTDVYPQHSFYRGDGFAVRLVKDTDFGMGVNA